MSELEVLQHIASREPADSVDLSSPPPTIRDLLRLCVDIKKVGQSPVHESLYQVCLRLLETNILRDEIILRIGERWQSVVGDAEALIEQRLLDLTGTRPPKALVAHLTETLGGTAFTYGRRGSDYEIYFENLVSANTRENGGRLRCACCGYHFRLADIGKGRNRKEIIFNSVVSLASDWHSERAENRDPWKPTHRIKNLREVSEGKPEKKEYFTQLTIEHLVPEESLGTSSLQNLALLCQFCNTGKQAYRRALEPISLFAAGGLSAYPRGRELNMLSQSVVVSALEFSRRTCSRCGKTARDTELTVRPWEHVNEALGHEAKGLAPWVLKTICYDCSPI